MHTWITIFRIKLKITGVPTKKVEALSIVPKDYISYAETSTLVSTTAGEAISFAPLRGSRML